jgi:hypothetical protein
VTSVEVPVARLGTDLKIPDALIPTTIVRSADLATLVAGLSTAPVTAASIGLGNVDNTHDIDKPVSSPVLAMLARVRIPWKQVGATYPTPLPTGFYGIAFEGINDPADQSGLTVTNNDTWTQLQA